jgi:outer membrane protein
VRSYESYAGITLALPIFEGFGRTYKIHEATGQVAQKREELAQVITQTDLDIWRNYQNFLAENSGLEAAADLLNAAREGFDAAETRYRVGITDIVEVLNNGKILAGARQEYVRAWSAWHGNRLKLLTSLGRAGFWLVDSLESTGSTR